ncbi:hypothetical protein LTR56_021511 [Elasticomyces elasticus]|nr:hypothetical protein LTR56_021511 [Elasticomyces elasticus]KAK3631250.1 hypothetical protein LTR22_021134 [Elasticomyces elasticus]KAK4909370.1 hypothetical protein LTR49_021882 [Elasticomyces elasticus]KAK5749398.1 hypothetical protein LTS12_020579 [Elasticomyces elasticus]
MMLRLPIEQRMVLQQKSSDREDTTATATTPSPSRPLALPAEIPNDIWDLVFSGFVLQREVNISYTDTPNKSLLLSNRQIFNEAKGLFSTRYLEYWKLTRFSITYKPSETPPAPRMTTPAPASRLLALPPEIRNAIWELSFSGTDRMVDLFESHAPSSDLLLACLQIYEEAKGFWPGKRGEYFSTTNFTITSPTSVLQVPASLSARDITAIRHIKVSVRLRDIRMVGSPRSTAKVYRMLDCALSSEPDCDHVLACVRLPGSSDWVSEEPSKMQQRDYVGLDVQHDGVVCATTMRRTKWIPGSAFIPITREELSVLLGRDI